MLREGFGGWEIGRGVSFFCKFSITSSPPCPALGVKGRGCIVCEAVSHVPVLLWGRGVGSWGGRGNFFFGRLSVTCSPFCSGMGSGMGG